MSYGLLDYLSLPYVFPSCQKGGNFPFCSPSIWQELKQTQAGVGGEIQLTDAIESLMTTEVVNAFHMVGVSYDCGDKLGYMKACVEFGLRHAELKAAFNEYLALRTLQDTSSIAA
ncbi:hypothetical protein [Vibrio mexicanus]|uniref:hypothetical protein n=1 Tax=Vibrio mexicanus TaxID=1004326 RepID=UPI00138E4485